MSYFMVAPTMEVWVLVDLLFQMTTSEWKHSSTWCYQLKAEIYFNIEKTKKSLWQPGAKDCSVYSLLLKPLLWLAVSTSQQWVMVILLTCCVRSMLITKTMPHKLALFLCVKQHLRHNWKKKNEMGLQKGDTSISSCQNTKYSVDSTDSFTKMKWNVLHIVSYLMWNSFLSPYPCTFECAVC